MYVPKHDIGNAACQVEGDDQGSPDNGNSNTPMPTFLNNSDTASQSQREAQEIAFRNSFDSTWTPTRQNRSGAVRVFSLTWCCVLCVALALSTNV
jgi:hypothetical protein